MTRKKLIMSPGPTNIPENYLALMAEEFPHHRTQEFGVLTTTLHENLRKLLFVEEGEVIVFTSSGTGGMESTVANPFNAGEKVLVINVGYFGERYTTITTRYGLDVLELKYPMGETYDLADVAEVLNDNPDICGVFVTHHETSTGVLNNIPALGELLSQYDDVLFVIDSISGLIVHPFYMTKWHVDAVTCSSQKGFLLPPGIAVVGLSPRAVEKAKTVTQPRFYFDYTMMIEFQAKKQIPSTPNITLMQAMLQSTNDMLASGLKETWKHHADLRAYVEAKLTEHGIELGVKDESIRGNVVVVAVLPEGVQSNTLCDLLETEYDIVVMPGLGPDGPRKIRIGLIGPLTTADADLFMDAFIDCLDKHFGIQI